LAAEHLPGTGVAEPAELVDRLRMRDDDARVRVVIEVAGRADLHPRVSRRIVDRRKRRADRRDPERERGGNDFVRDRVGHALLLVTTLPTSRTRADARPRVLTVPRSAARLPARAA